MSGPGQASLFDDPREGLSAEALVTVAAGNARLSAVQREFNRLTDRIRRERAALAEWQAYKARFERRVAGELGPLERELAGAQRRLVQRLDALLQGRDTGGERLSRRHRDKARSLIAALLEVLMIREPDPELERLYKRHCGAEEPPGPAIFDEILSAAAEPRGRRARAQPPREAGPTAVREIYRRLASAFHPDREADAAERERKTALMQRANQAYEAGDLLQLLALQVETEQVGAAAFAALPEERLRRYNQALREQLAALEREVRQCAAGMSAGLDLPAFGLTPKRVDQALEASLAEARKARARIETDLGRLDDPRQRRAFLDELPDPEPEDVDLDDLAVLEALLSEPLPSAPRRRKRRPRRA